MNPKNQKIVKLKAENIKRINAVELEVDIAGGLVVVAGNNGEGKSSLLDSIVWALGGKGEIQDEPIQFGRDSARTVVELNDIIVTRSYHRQDDGRITSNLLVKGRDGLKLDSPQQVLDRLVGSLTFDPLAFTLMKPGEQYDTLTKLVGLDLDTLDKEYKATEDARRESNRSIKELTTRRDGIPAPGPLPEVEVSVDELKAELTRRQNANKSAIKGQGARVQADQLVAKRRQELAHVEHLLTLAIEAQKSTLEEFPEKAEMDEAEVVEQIAKAASLAGDRANAKMIDNLNEEITTAATASSGFSETMERIKATKAQMVEGAAFPIDGLEVAEGVVRYNGAPLHQSSSAEQLKVSVAMGLASNPNLRVMLIRDGSLLDERSLLEVKEMIEEAGAQLWIEVVGEREGATVIIEDGSIKEEVTHGV